MFGFRKQDNEHLETLHGIIKRQDDLVNKLLLKIVDLKNKLDKAKEPTVEYIPPATIPYQRCPICEGSGAIKGTGASSERTFTCPCCDGAMIIPMHVVENITCTPINETNVILNDL